MAQCLRAMAVLQENQDSISYAVAHNHHQAGRCYIDMHAGKALTPIECNKNVFFTRITDRD